MTRTSARAAATALVLVFCLATPAGAGEDGRAVVRHGDCSDVSRWRLVVRPAETGGLRVRFLLGGGAAGQTWNVFLDHNGEGFFAGSRVSREDGIVAVRRLVDDAPGQDTIRAGAHNTDTGETCAGRVVV